MKRNDRKGGIFGRIAFLALTLALTAGCSLQIRSLRTPKPISSLIQPQLAMSTGGHACFVDSDGSLRCWGNNTSSQSKFYEKPVPPSVSGITPATTLPTVSLNPYTPTSIVATTVSSGVSHACAILAGKLFCWGSNSDGQLGDGTASGSDYHLQEVFSSGATQVSANNNRTCAIVSGALYCWGTNPPISLSNYSPTLLFASGVTAISVGALHACAIVSGSLQCWGDNSQKQITNSGSSAITTPFEVFSSGVTSVSVGYQHTCAIVSGSLQCWGANSSGQTGNGSPSPNVASPYSVFASGVTAVAAGAYHTCAVVSGVLKCWGVNNLGQLGIGTTSGYETAPQDLGLTNIDYLTAGQNNTCAHSTSGALSCWGYNGNGVVGTGSVGANVLSPYSVFSSGVTFASMSAASTHACAIVSGNLKCWGGQIPLFGASYSPVQIMGPYFAGGSYPYTQAQTLQSVSIYNHTCVVEQTGALKCWGSNNVGQIGNGSLGGSVFTPYEVFSSGATAVSVSYYHTCAVVSGSLKCWGSNGAFGMGGWIGNGKTSGNTVTPYTVFSSGVTAVVAGAGFTCAIVSGSLQCWGYNSNGQVGTGNNGSTIVSPYTVFTSGVTAVAAGANYACAVVSGSLKCWGANGYGQIGNGSSGGDVLTPYEVFSSGVTAVATSSAYGNTCAIVSGSLRCWGYNTNGEVGTGSSGGNILLPQTTIPSGVTSISIGVTHSCAVVSGSLQCWGSNAAGESNYGDATLTTATPTTIIHSGVSSVSAGYLNTCAIASNRLQCWGNNGNGQLGNGNTTTINGIGGQMIVTPNTLFSSGVTQVATGYSHTCAILSGGLQCWGSNVYGEIGNHASSAKVDHPYAVFSTGVTDVAAGYFHTCAVVSGALKCWGLNMFGEIAHPTDPNTTEPYTAISSGVARVFVGLVTTCALKTDQTLWCFGHMSSGLFNNGDDSGSFVASPTQVSLPTGKLIDLSISFQHACGIFEESATRKLYCWGGNESGEIIDDSVYGTGLTAQLISTSPTLTSVSATTSISVSSSHTCWLDHAQLSCRGSNDVGQIDPANAGNVILSSLSLESNASIAAAGGAATCALVNHEVRCTGKNQLGILGASIPDGATGTHVSVLSAKGL